MHGRLYACLNGLSEWNVWNGMKCSSCTCSPVACGRLESRTVCTACEKGIWEEVKKSAFKIQPTKGEPGRLPKFSVEPWGEFCVSVLHF